MKPAATTGVYCFRNLPARTVQATAAAPAFGGRVANVTTGPGLPVGCPSDTRTRVTVFALDGTPRDDRFIVWFLEG